MKILYFEDVDVLEFVYRGEVGPVAKTVDGPGGHSLMDYDEAGRLVGMTVHAASQNMDLDAVRESADFEAAARSGPAADLGGGGSAQGHSVAGQPAG